MVDLDPSHFRQPVDRFEERPARHLVDPDERQRIGTRTIVTLAAAIAVLVGLGVIAAVASLSSSHDRSDATSTTVALRRLLFTVAPAGTTLADAAETAGAPRNARRSVAALAGPDGAVATVSARLEDGSRWPPSGVEDTVTLTTGDTGYLDPDLVWRRGGVRYRVQLGTDTPDRRVLLAIADGVRPTADTTGTEPAAFTVTAPDGWRVRYTGADPDDAPTATALYRGDGRTVQVTTWAIAGALDLVTARATSPSEVSVRGVDAILWRDTDGPLTSTATAHLVWQEPDGVLVHLRSNGITDAELLAATGTLTTAPDARWHDALGTSSPAVTSAVGEGVPTPPPTD